MQSLIALGAGVALLSAGAATAAPQVEIRHAVARVTVIPEARTDIEVTVVKANARLPLKVSRLGNDVFIDGGLGMRPRGCHSAFGKPRAMVWGIGDVGYDDMPQVVIRTPMTVKVSAGDIVYGSVGRSDSVELGNSGCGDWTVANVAGPMRVNVAGSGDVRTGSAASAEVHVSGSGDVATRDIRGGLNASTSGSGDIVAASIDGPFHVHVSGSGNVRAHAGSATDMAVWVAGSGDVSFGGGARSLEASIAGSGDVRVAKVTGAVARHVAGSGDVHVGS